MELTELIQGLLFAISIGLFGHLFTNKLIQEGNVFHFVQLLIYKIIGTKELHELEGWREYFYNAFTCSTCLSMRWSLYLFFASGLTFSLMNYFMFVTLAGFVAYKLDDSF